MLNLRTEGERAVRSSMEILRGTLPPKPVTIPPVPPEGPHEITRGDGSKQRF
jgi:hypothetical protein